MNDHLWEKWMTWLTQHPRTVLYLLTVTTLNLVLQLVEVLR